MLLSKQKVTMEVPGDPGHSMTFKGLSWSALKTARDAKQADALQGIKGIDIEMAETIQHLRSKREEDAKKDDPETAAARKLVEEAFRDPINDYDMGVVLHEGIISWTYDEPLTPRVIDEELPEPVAIWAFRAIIGLSTATEEELGKSPSSSSTITRGEEPTPAS